jgi:hypothetical protein
VPTLQKFHRESWSQICPPIRPVDSPTPSIQRCHLFDDLICSTIQSVRRPYPFHYLICSTTQCAPRPNAQLLMHCHWQRDSWDRIISKKMRFLDVAGIWICDFNDNLIVVACSVAVKITNFWDSHFHFLRFSDDQIGSPELRIWNDYHSWRCQGPEMHEMKWSGVLHICEVVRKIPVH